jgi:hypothetical protein
MLKYKILMPEGLLILRPEGALTKSDFDGLREFVDEHLAKYKILHGVAIHTKTFPGWDSFSGLIAHIQFVRSHHKRIEKIALVTDSRIVNAIEVLAQHFICAEVRKFAYADYIVALAWLKSA